MPEIKFHFIKAPSYHEFLAHGAFGGLSPSGRTVFLGLYSERNPLPTSITHEINEAGILGAENVEKREMRDGIIRTLQCGVHLDLASATALRDWLSIRIAESASLAPEEDA